MHFEPLDVTDRHTQEDIGAESVDIRAIHRRALPDRSTVCATNH